MKPTKQNKSILKKDEDALHFYCPREDGMFTFIYQHDGKIYPFTHILPKEQEDDLFKLKLQF